jgi:hypothetical protein
MPLALVHVVLHRTVKQATTSHSLKRAPRRLRKSHFIETPVLFDDRIDTVRDECSSIVRCFRLSITEELASFRRHSPERAAVLLEFDQFKTDWNPACP